MRPDPPWVSATDLAEYAFCPRSLYYRRRAPDAPETPAESAGRRYHARVLAAERRRSDHPAAYWLGLAVGLLLVLLAAVAELRP
ncbi:MAG TPA: hypothetical protein VML94_05680 [Thermoplasmata archaeon]|nr:hypothetical protein [Thermoplasmata archaeon]